MSKSFYVHCSYSKIMSAEITWKTGPRILVLWQKLSIHDLDWALMCCESCGCFDLQHLQKSVLPNIRHRLHLRGKSPGSFNWHGIYVLFPRGESVFCQSISLVAEYCRLYSGIANSNTSVSKAILSPLNHPFIPNLQQCFQETFHWKPFLPVFPPQYTTLLPLCFLLPRHFYFSLKQDSVTEKDEVVCHR